ncbi:MAG TPA: hypothetical protein VK099_02915 [Alcanivoracaceae bacterium]|nr:hypothetical protein [Alcanivoracaceae bacterium]
MVETLSVNDWGWQYNDEKWLPSLIKFNSKVVGEKNGVSAAIACLMN